MTNPGVPPEKGAVLCLAAQELPSRQPSQRGWNMAELGLAILVIGVLLVADPDRLQALLDRIRELSAWLAE